MLGLLVLVSFESLASIVVFVQKFYKDLKYLQEPSVPKVVPDLQVLLTYLSTYCIWNPQTHRNLDVTVGLDYWGIKHNNSL